MEFLIFCLIPLLILMATDISNEIIQNILSIINIILVYIAKFGVWIGILLTTERASKLILYKETKLNLTALSKGFIIIFVSLILYVMLI